MSEKDNRGNIVRDYRYKITQSDLVTWANLLVIIPLMCYYLFILSKV
jgi:hypothetical protein